MFMPVLPLFLLSLAGQPGAPTDAERRARAVPPIGRSQSKAMPTLTSEGYDTIRIGMRPQDVRGYTLDGEPESQECRYFTAKEAPDLVLIVEGGIITRISIQRADGGLPRARTARGIGIGATEAQVKAAYKPLREKEAKYEDPPATDLTWMPVAGGSGLRFVTSTNRRVGQIHAGREPALGYVEGCL